VKITIIYDNTAFRENLKADWGFSCLVEKENTPTILFDTGADGKILLDNMQKLGIDPLSIEEVFISHLHSDHTGGLNEVLKANSKIKKIYLPSSLELNGEVVLKEPQKIHDDVFSTGELEGIEQSMGIETDKGIVLIVGCSHPEMGYILDAAKKFGKIYAIIGGMHGFSEFELFKDLEIICPTHCTQYKAELKELYPQKYIEGGAGKIIEI
jgi:7,8-dihydropterin-6-yl-methyl-4-(beta-D-ribofuranosyl)aminobenzene 5'-phosphate synthase